MKNDVSFMIMSVLNIWEHQSSFNPNMPLRMPQLLASLYERHVTQAGKNKFSGSQLSLPVPRLVVLFDGRTDKPDETTLALSDSFPPGADSDVEVRVRMTSINPDKSPRPLGGCRASGGYAWLVDRVRAGVAAGGDVADAIDEAIDGMPDGFEVKPFLVAHKAEVRGMLLTEYDEARTMELFKKEGREEGIDLGAFDVYVGLVGDGVLSPADAARRLGVTEAQFRDRCATWTPLSARRG
jgi:hypothetical protein